MLPKFPEFKKLELSDRADVEKFTSKFDPYSDFNFVEMWSWNLKNSMEISQLNGNLVIQPNDYFSDNYSLSYLGNNELADTLDKLFAYMVLEGVDDPVLKFVPEVSLHGINLDQFLIEIDLDNCDYVYDLSQHTSYSGPDYSSKRKHYNRFIRHHKNFEFKELNMTDPATTELISALDDRWVDAKSQQSKEINFSKELEAINRFIKANFKETFLVGLFVDNKLIGYQLFSLLANNYSICHFGKADFAYHGAFEYLMSESAKLLVGKGIKYLNTAEDLGLPSLRFTKNSYRPINFLRKYSIRKR